MKTRSFPSTPALHRWVLCGLGSLALACSGAHAAVVTYAGNDPGANSTDPRPNSNLAAAQFDPAAGTLGPVNFLNFENVALGSFSSLSLGNGVTLSGTDYLGGNQTIRNSAAGTPDGLYGYNTTFGGANFVYINAGTLTFTFSQPIDAFGGYFSGVQFAGETVTFNDGTAQTLTLTNSSSSAGGVEFLGFTDAGRKISSVTINTPNPSNTLGDFIGLDDVRFSLAPVPEPSVVALLAGAGAAGLGAWLRARRARAC